MPLDLIGETVQPSNERFQAHAAVEHPHSTVEDARSALTIGRVLIVDGDAATLANSKDVLSGEMGADVTTAGTGQEALGLVRQETFDVILADLHLPDMIGLEILAKIRATGDRVPFVIVTGLGTIQSSVEAVRFGAAEYLEKPLTRDHLVRLVRAVQASPVASTARDVDATGCHPRRVRDEEPFAAAVRFTDLCALALNVPTSSPRMVIGQIEQLLPQIPAALTRLDSLMVRAALMELASVISCRYCNGEVDGVAAIWAVGTDRREIILAVESFLRSVRQCAQTDSRVARALRIIKNEHARPQLGLQHVAAAAGLSRCYLSRRLTECTGEPFLVHLHRTRVAFATQLLRHTCKSIKEIAYEVGYTETRQLDRYFKRVLATTPREYRQTWQAANREVVGDDATATAGHDFERTDQ